MWYETMSPFFLHHYQVKYARRLVSYNITVVLLVLDSATCVQCLHLTS